MSAKGASLSNYNQELVRCIEDLREKREEVNRSILRDEEEKAKIQRELTKMTERLSRLNEDLARKMQVSVFGESIVFPLCSVQNFCAHALLFSVL